MSLEGLLAKGTRIVGFARREKSHEQFRVEIEEALVESARSKPNAGSTELKVFSSSCYYQVGNYDNSKSFHDLKELLERFDEEYGVVAGKGNRLFYLATPPTVFFGIVGMLGQAGHIADPNDEERWTRVIIEKPFGRDLETASALNKNLSAVLDESQIYRIDHYLGKETVQNIMALRFSNRFIMPLWDSSNIDHVQITVAESVGVEGRWGYYDKYGAMRDMIQNHLMQLLCLIAMEPPCSLDANNVRDEKVKVLRSLRTIDASNIAQNTVRAQYKAGMSEGQSVPGYLEGDGVSKSTTETFAAIKVDIDNWRWNDVPFYIRSGKRMQKRNSEIIVQFKEIPHSIFNDTDEHISQNKLVITLQPKESIKLCLLGKVPGLGESMKLQEIDLELHSATNTARKNEAYERLILDVINDNPTLFMRLDEVEEAWKWTDSIIKAWSENLVPMKSYQAGTDGPTASIQLIAKDGRAWHEQ